MRVLPISSQNDIPNEYPIIGSSVSGGTFTGYLERMLEQHRGKVCLYLQSRACRFLLPCCDGQGDEISHEELDSLCGQHPPKFSDALCFNWLFIKDPPTVILYDDPGSLRKKYDLAEKAGVPFLIAEPSVLEKIKTP